MDKIISEQHPLGFFLPENTRVLMLGSFPPQRERWSMNFYYPNFQNDMWRILGLVFYNDKNYFVAESGKAFDEIKARYFCNEYGIGIGDTAKEIIRLNRNASDKFLQVVTPFDPDKILSSVPLCTTLVITGQKAMETLLTVWPVKEPKIGTSISSTFMERTIRIYRMPSTSRAYPKPLPDKAEYYRQMFREIGLIK